MWYWVALSQVTMTKTQGGIRIFTLASHRSEGSNIVISLSHTVGCQAVLCFRTFSERIECRSNVASAGDVPQWRMNKTDCRHQGVCQSEPRLQLWMCRDEEGDEKFPLFPDTFCAVCPRIQPHQLSMTFHLQENQERMWDQEGTRSSASTCICIQALKYFPTMRSFPPIPRTIRSILRISPSSLLPSAMPFVSSGRVSW